MLKIDLEKTKQLKNLLTSNIDTGIIFFARHTIVRSRLGTDFSGF